jgi:hypothetical protein
MLYWLSNFSELEDSLALRGFRAPGAGVASKSGGSTSAIAQSFLQAVSRTSLSMNWASGRRVSAAGGSLLFHASQVWVHFCAEDSAEGRKSMPQLHMKASFFLEPLADDERATREYSFQCFHHRRWRWARLS